MKFAYADPPYPGQVARHYADEAGACEVNHTILIGTLCRDYDGWALSTSSTSLRYVLGLCPDDVRVGAWVKPFASFKPNVNPGYTWEPVIFRGGRKLGRKVPTVRDYVACNITLKRGLSGAKPDAVCDWILAFLGFRDGDEIDDLFPGTGTMRSAIERARTALFQPDPEEMAS